MPKACEQCGADCIKTRGKYQELCPDCLDDAVDTHDRYLYHFEDCDSDDCLMCDELLEHIDGWTDWLYVAVQVRKGRRENENYRLEQFK